MTFSELREIALHAIKGTVPANYAKEGTQFDMDAAFADGLKELAGSVNMFMKNRYDIYQIIVESVDEVLPKTVASALAPFAEVQTVAQGEKAIFKKRAGKERAKKFLTQVGLSGVYETFRLDSNTFEVAAHAVGGGATIDFERMLDGAESLAEVASIISDGLIDAVYMEVQKALRAAFNNMPNTNKYEALGDFEADKMVQLMNVVRAYGDGVTIFAPPEFVAAMGPDAIVPIGGANTNPVVGIYSPDDIEAIHRTGYINIFRGAPIVQIPQSFIDETNTKTWIDPQLAYILPTGKEKVVKVVLEGQTQIKDHENRDNSIELYAWKKMGCAILTNYNWATYKMSNIPQTMENPYGF